MSEPKMIKLAYDEGESGWAEDLGDGKARIANLPLAGDLNVDDVVKVVKRDGRSAVGERVARAFAQKTGITYPEPHKETYAKLAQHFHTKGWKMEGMVPGTAFVAHPGTLEDVKTAAREVDVELVHGEDLL